MPNTMDNDNEENRQTVTFSMEIIGKLKERLANFDQVDEALQLEPENEDLQKLRMDLLEVIRLVSKELIRSERVDAETGNHNPGIHRVGCSTVAVTIKAETVDLEQLNYFPEPNDKVRQEVDLEFKPKEEIESSRIPGLRPTAEGPMLFETPPEQKEGMERCYKCTMYGHKANGCVNRRAPRSAFRKFLKPKPKRKPVFL